MTRIHTITFVLLGLVILMLSGCEWVKSDLDDCPVGQWLNLDYSYNLQDINAASKLEDVTVLIYDSLGNYVNTIVSTKAERTLHNGLIELKDIAAGIYNIVVWAGVADTDHLTLYHSFGVPIIDSLRVGLKNSSQNQNEEFSDLYYGFLSGVKINDKTDIYDVKLMKDTNKLVCLVRYNDKDSITTDNFTFDVIAPNGLMNAKNEIISNHLTTYQPYSEENVTIIDEEQNDTVSAVRYGFQIMRLLAKDNSRLILKRKPSDDVVFDIPLTQYIGQISVLYNLYGQPLSVQEYLDRQDFHTFIFYISKENNDQPMMIKINNWIVRLDDNIYLKGSL